MTSWGTSLAASSADTVRCSRVDFTGSWGAGEWQGRKVQVSDKSPDVQLEVTGDWQVTGDYQWQKQ